MKIKELDPADIKPTTEATLGKTNDPIDLAASSDFPKNKFLKQQPDVESGELNGEIEHALVVVCAAEVTGSIHLANAFLDSFSHNI